MSLSKINMAKCNCQTKTPEPKYHKQTCDVFIEDYRIRFIAHFEKLGFQEEWALSTYKSEDLDYSGSPEDHVEECISYYDV